MFTPTNLLLIIVPILLFSIASLKFQTPVRTAKRVASILGGIILAKRENRGKKKSMLVIRANTESEKIRRNKSGIPN